MKLKSGTIYFLRDYDFLTREYSPYLKIGLVADPTNTSKRIRQLQTGNPRPIACLREVRTKLVTELESYLHRFYALRRVLHEWFYINNDELDMVVEDAEKVSVSMEEVCGDIMLADALKAVESSYGTRSPSAEESSCHQRFLELHTQIVTLEARKKILENEIKAEAGSASEIEGVYNAVQKKLAQSFDRTLLKNDHPEIYCKFISEHEKVSGTFKVLGTQTLKDLDSDLYQRLLESRPPTVECVESFIIKRESSIASKHEAYLSLLSDLAPLTLEKNKLNFSLRIACACNEEIEGVCTWKRERQYSTNFDKELFMANHPDLHDNYLKAVQPSIAQKIRRYRAYDFFT